MSSLAPAPALLPKGQMTIRPGNEADVADIQAIYAHHVETGTGTFEEKAPTQADMLARRHLIAAGGLPYIVAESEGMILGFAYAAQFRPRSAYRFTVEDSIYVHPDAVGRGVGRCLLTRLIEQSRALGLQQMVAVIGDSNNHRSIRLHEGLGFTEAGRLVAAGYKFGRWLDVVFMQLRLAPSDPGERSPLQSKMRSSGIG